MSLRVAAPTGVALVLVGLNLRLGIASVPSIVDQVRDALALSSAAVGAVTTLPVLCFGLAAFGAPGLARRWGEEPVILACLALIAAGIAARLIRTVPAFFAGTLALGVGVAVANVLVPGVIKRFSRRPETMTALVVAATMGGAGVAIALTVPLSRALGGWDRALAVWALPAVVAALVWAPLARLRTRDAAVSSPVRVRGDRRAWVLAGMFACQTLLGFALLAWTPKILHDSGLGQGEAGVLAAIVMTLGIPSAVLAPLALARGGVTRGIVIAASVPWWAGLAGLLWSPAEGTVVWTVLLGLGQGAGFALPLSLIVLQSRDSRHAAALSGMVQGIGYVFGGLLGPLAIGALHDSTGGWEAPLVVLMAVVGAQLALGLAVVSSSASARTGTRGSGAACPRPADTSL